MKKYLYFTLLLSLISASPLMAQSVHSLNLHQLAKNNGITVYNREMTLITETGHEGIRLSPDIGEGVAWIKGVDFSSGSIEMDVRGKNEKQRSFVGLAFHGKDNITFDAIYLRPFQFLEQSEELRKRSVQYISLPDYPWRSLRENSPGKYESSINVPADPDGWVHIKVVIKDKTVSVYINYAEAPCLVVEKVTDLKNGSVGLYVADVSGGDFANLKITKAD